MNKFEQKTYQLRSSKQITWLVFEEKSPDNQSLPIILDQFSMHLWCHFFIQWPHFLTVRYRNWISLFLAMLFYGLKLFKETVKLFLWKITILILKSTFFPKPFLWIFIILHVFGFGGKQLLIISEFTNNFIVALKLFQICPAKQFKLFFSEIRSICCTFSLNHKFWQIKTIEIIIDVILASWT